MKASSLKKYSLVIATVILIQTPVMAHSPICDCYDNGDKTITCEGGFSDGSSASGVEIRIMDEQGKILQTGKMDDDSNYTFTKPSVEFHVIFDAGNNHVVTIYGGDIEE